MVKIMKILEGRLHAKDKLNLEYAKMCNDMQAIFIFPTLNVSPVRSKQDLSLPSL